MNYNEMITEKEMQIEDIRDRMSVLYEEGTEEEIEELQELREELEELQEELEGLEEDCEEYQAFGNDELARVGMSERDFI